MARRIVIWHDADGTFEDEFNRMATEGLDDEPVIAKIKNESLIRYPTERMLGYIARVCVTLQKHLKKLQEQLKEASGYEERVRHLADQMIAIDLDDGVKVNYAKFLDVLVKIK